MTETIHSTQPIQETQPNQPDQVQPEDLLTQAARLIKNTTAILSTPSFTTEQEQNYLADQFDTYVKAFLESHPKNGTETEEKYLHAFLDDIKALYVVLPEIVHGINLRVFMEEGVSSIDMLFERCRWLNQFEIRNEPVLVFPSNSPMNPRYVSEANQENIQHLLDVFSSIMASIEVVTKIKDVPELIVRPFVECLIYPVFASFLSNEDFPFDVFDKKPVALLPIYSHRYRHYATGVFGYKSAISSLIKEKDEPKDEPQVQADKEDVQRETRIAFRTNFKIVDWGEGKVLYKSVGDDWVVIPRPTVPVQEACYDSVIRELIELDANPEVVYTIETQDRTLDEAIENVKETQAKISLREADEETVITFFKVS